MSEEERIERLLRRTAAAWGQPAPQPDFERRVMWRLRPRRLSRARRLVMALYALLALAVSVWAMRSEAFDWDVVVLSILLQVVAVLFLGRRRVLLPS